MKLTCPSPNLELPKNKSVPNHGDARNNGHGDLNGAQAAFGIPIPRNGKNIAHKTKAQHKDEQKCRDNFNPHNALLAGKRL